MSNKKHAGKAAPGTSADAQSQFSAEESLGELWAVIESGDILDAEVQVAGLLALPALNRSTRSEEQTFVAGLITTAARMQPRESAAAFYRLLMTLGSPSLKKMASGALRELTSSGVYPPGWVTEIGKPVPGEAWHRYDVFGDEEAVVVTFSYDGSGDSREHAVLVRIDRTVLPTAVTVGISPEPDRLVTALKGAEDEQFERVEQVSLARARELIEAPLNRARPGGSRGLSPSSATFLPVARAHARRLPTAAEAGEPAAGARTYTAADRAAAVEAFLASPPGAGLPDGDVARFWAQALTGYSGRIAGEPPAQAGPRKLVAMLGHAASTFALTGAQRAGLPAVVTAWARWAAGNQGLDADATEHLLTDLPKTLEQFDAAYDDPQSKLARDYVSDLAAADGDVTELAGAVTRRSVAVPYPSVGADGQPELDVTDPAARAAMIAREFASCSLDPGQSREDLVAAATRVTEELWAGEPPATWAAARAQLADGRSRHDALHALIART
ncbi:MAG TPA: hypothetical protein VH478_01365 [Trebonia sp.]|nr:hypothetical protein [Trebonia sp.]